MVRISRTNSAVPAGKLLLVLVLVTLFSFTVQADQTADLARYMALEEAFSEVRERMQSGEFTRAEMKAKQKAIRQQQSDITRSYGKRGTSDRREWDKAVSAARQERYQARQEAKQAERNAQAKAEAEAAAAAKQAVYEARAAEASKYSQMHLPEEIIVPLATTDVQGIEFGMPREEAWRVLVENGYATEADLRMAGGGKGGRIVEAQSSRSLILAYQDYKIPEMSGLRVRLIRYEQQFMPEVKFEQDAIAKQLKDKYGIPTRETSGPQGVLLIYNIEPPDYNLEVACKEEMEARGTAPDRPYPPLAGPTSGKVWLERGERDVKERCPDQLQIFRHVMHAQMDVRAAINVNAQTKEIIIEIQDNGWQQRPSRRRNEEIFLKKDGGESADVKL